MVNVLVRNLPDDVHAALLARARNQGTSLQQFLTDELRRIAATPSLQEVLERIESRRGGSVGLSAAVDDLDVERAQR